MLVAVVFAASAAFAGPSSTSWVNEYPVPGSVLSEKAGVVGVDAFSSSALLGDTRRITIDGTAYNTFLTNPVSANGHWALRDFWDDDAEVWYSAWTWVADPDTTKATLTSYGWVGNSQAGPLATDGTHTVVASIKNASGTVSSDTWTYSIHIPPVIGTPSPAPGSQLDTLTPDISVPVSDNSAVASWTVTVNGAPASATLSGGSLHIVLPAALTNEKPVTIALTARDAVGSSASYTWGYTVETFPGMVDTSGSCVACHPTSATDPDMTAICSDCHSGFSAPHAGDPSTFHAKADNTCAPCHLTSLTAEHARWNTQGGLAITCLTCHASTAPNVVAAIASGSSNCGGCHDTSNPHAGIDLSAKHTASPVAADISFLGVDYGTKTCEDCHDDNIMNSHTGGCATCHPDAYNTVASGWNQGCVQGDCHTASSTAPMHANVDSAHTIAASDCAVAGCHAGGTNVAEIHKTEGCATCHGTDGTPSKTCTDCHNMTSPHGDLSGDHLASPADQVISISGKSYGSHACSECHAQPVLTDIHGSDCTKCHPSPKNTLTPSWNRECAQGGCHTAGSSAPMHANIDASHAVGGSYTSCETGAGCHSGSLAELHSQATTTVAGVTSTSCQICHKTDGSTPTGDCATCHGDVTALHADTAKHTAVPASQDATIAGVDYGPLVCSDCHQLEIMSEHNNSCATCHPSPKDSTQPAWDKNCATAGCHTPSSTAPMHANIDSAHVVPSVTCTNVGCHDTNGGSLAALHSNASTVTAGGATLTSCQICHAPGVTPTNQCSVCHDTSSPHAAVPDSVHAATFTTQTITILGTNVGDHNCGDCHQSNSLLTIHGGNCAACHPAPKNTLTPSWDKSCQQGGCHSIASSAPQHGNIDNAHKVDTLNCADAGCHASGLQNLAAIHSNASTTTAGGVTLTSCQICHAQGQTASATCTDCHDTNNPHPDAMTLSHSVTQPSCSTGPSCHNLTPGDVASLHKNKCEDCHDRDDGVQPSTDCSVCHSMTSPHNYNHADYQVGIHSAATTGSITIIGTTFDNVVCASCHNASSITSDTPNGSMALGALHDNTCASCHPGIVPNTLNSWNQQCDANGCHSATNTATGAQPVHVKADGTTLDVAHQMQPQIKDCLAGGKCHSGTSLPQIHQNATLTENGTTYTGCQVCHKNSLNVPVVPDFYYPDGTGPVSNDCLGCHPDRYAQHGYTSSWHTAETTGDVQVTSTTISNVVCADCHARSTETSSNPLGTMELGPIHAAQNRFCDNCHPYPRRTIVGEWDKSCSDDYCHGQDGTVQTHENMNAAHTPTPGTSCMIDGCHLKDTQAPGWGDDLPQIHKDATATVNGVVVKGCLVCHYNNQWDPQNTGTPVFTVDSNGIPSTKECAACHPANATSTMHAYSFTNHTSSNPSATITIGATTWGPMPCTRCHYAELSSEHARNISGFKSNGCLNCHPDPYSSLEAPGQSLGGWNKTCVQGGCHSPSGANAMHASVTASHTPLPADNSCFAGTACHTNDGATLADIHSQATTTVVTPTGTQVRTQCDVCHGDYASQSQPPSADCLYCHPEKQINGQVASHVNTDTLHPVVNTPTSCTSDNSSCHYATLAKEHFRYSPKAGGSFTCETCHSSTDPNTIAAIANHNTACSACHTTTHGQQTPASSASCQDCHGTTSTEISNVSTSGVYANTGGDHLTGWSSAAHASVQTTPTLGTQATSIQCTVCHDHSRKTLPKYLNYRYTGWPTPAQNHEDLCYQCHTATTTFVNEPNKPNTWNGRSVQAQFQLASKHTISTGNGSYVDQEIPNPSLNESTAAQFSLDTLSNVSVLASPAVQLSQDLSGGTNPPSISNVLFAMSGSSTKMDQYVTTDNKWDSADSAMFTPATAPGSPATGSSAFKITGDNHIYVPTASTCYVYTPPADPTADSWTTNTNFAAGAALGAGGDTAVNATGTTTTGQCIYYLRGGATNYVYMKPFAGSATAAAIRIQYPSGTSLNQGAGSAIAFSPMTNRTFVINKNGTTAADGRLYYYTGINRPSGTTSTTVWAQGPSITTSSTATTVYNRITCATIAGTDYLFTIGPNSTGSLSLQVVNNLGGTPTVVTGIGVLPPNGWTSTGDGCDIKYNAADGYIYATRGGNTTGFARIKVPANPGTASSWSSSVWETLTASPTWAAGASIEFANADSPLIVPFKYFSAGTITSSAFSAVSGSKYWGKLYFNESIPANTALSVRVQGYNSGTTNWDTLAAAASASPLDLSSYDCTTYPQLRLTATMSTNNPTNSASTPQLYSWAVTNIKQTYVPPSGSLIQCENCHNTHLVQKGSGAWDKGRVVDPYNVKSLWSSTGGSWSGFCLRCHTGTGSGTLSLTPMISATSIIPYNVAFRSVSAPWFTGFNKTITGMDWGSSGHGNGSESSVTVQTTVADFTGDASSNTTITNVAGGEVKLGIIPGSQYNPPAQTGLGITVNGGSTTVDQYKPSEDKWNSSNSASFTPAALPASGATGASMITVGGKLYYLTGSTAYMYTAAADPVADSWVASANLAPTSLGAGGDSAASASNVYISRGGANSRIYWHPVAGGTGNYGTIQYPSGTSLSQGQGSSIAYAKTGSNNRLFVVNKNGATSADGRVYYYDNFGAPAATSLVFTQGPQVTQSGTTAVYTRSTILTQSSTDYLAILGPNSSGTLQLQVLNAAGTPAVMAAIAGPTGWTLGDGCDLEYNSADGYLYALRGGANTAFARILVPTTPGTAASWGAWQTLSGLRSWTAGSAIGFVNCDPPAQGAPSYYSSGSIQSPQISIPGGAKSWGSVYFSSPAIQNTAVSVTVSGYNTNTSSWVTLLSNQTVSPINLALYPSTTYSKLQLTGNLSTSVSTATPELDDWQVSANVVAANAPSCNNCHDPHGSNNQAMVAYTSIDNSTTVRDNSTATAGSALCYKCHGTGTGVHMDVQGAASGTYGHPIASSAAIHNDEETTASLITNRHADCSDCHNPHAAQKGLHTASSNTSNGGAVLNGVAGVAVTSWGSNWTSPTPSAFTRVILSTGKTPIGSGLATTSVEAYLCFKCHTSAGGSIQKSVTTNSGTYVRTDLATDFNPNNWSFHNVTGQSTAVNRNAAANVYTYKDSTGATVNQTWQYPTISLSSGWTANSAMTCTDCHTGGTTSQAGGPHGSTQKWMIDPGYPLDYASATLSNYSTSICGKCHTSLTSSNSAHASSHHSSYKCIQCHIAVPHGWKRPRMMVYATDGAPYFQGGTGLTGFKSTSSHTLSGNSASWAEGDCYTNCGNHGSVGSNAVMP